MKGTTNRNMVEIIQHTLDYVDTRLVHHGRRVADTVCRVLTMQGTCDDLTMRDLCFLALIHDIGAYKTEEIDQMMRFEQDNVHSHSIYGALFVQYLTPLGALAPVIEHHHSSLSELRGLKDPLAFWAQIIHLADRADIYLQNPHSDPHLLREHLEDGRKTRFSDEALDLFLKTIKSDHAIFCDNDELLNHVLTKVPYTLDELSIYFRTIIFAIDFRSRHTVTHTVCTTNISRTLATIMGITGDNLEDIVFGALLHDLGKIGIPVEILEYPGKLSPQAMRVMRTHVNLTEGILGGYVRQQVLDIALRHHEKLDGSGYPLGLSAKNLNVAQRIVAVADIMSALCGTRSYKDVFSKEKTIEILSKQAQEGGIDPDITALLIERYDEIYAAMEDAASPVRDMYETLNTRYLQMMQDAIQSVNHQPSGSELSSMLRC